MLTGDKQVTAINIGQACRFRDDAQVAQSPCEQGLQIIHRSGV